VEKAPDALRKARLHARLDSSDAVRIAVPPYNDVSDPETGVLQRLDRQRPSAHHLMWCYVQATLWQLTVVLPEAWLRLPDVGVCEYSPTPLWFAVLRSSVAEESTTV
jgi:hypothetical protein